MIMTIRDDTIYNTNTDDPEKMSKRNGKFYSAFVAVISSLVCLEMVAIIILLCIHFIA